MPVSAVTVKGGCGLKSRTTIGRPKRSGVSPAVVHEYPDSTVHADEQPSPFDVLPSSHASFGNRIPSPHADVQAEPTAHVGVQPSPQSWLPSSQASVPSRPFCPHTVRRQTDGVSGPPVHTVSSSMRQ